MLQHARPSIVMTALVLSSVIRGSNCSYIFGYLLHNPLPDESSVVRLIYDQKMAADEPSFRSLDLAELVTTLPTTSSTDHRSMLNPLLGRASASSALQSSAEVARDQPVLRRKPESVPEVGPTLPSPPSLLSSSSPSLPLHRKRNKKRRSGHRSKAAASASPSAEQGKHESAERKT